MGKKEKLIQKILNKEKAGNVTFDELLLALRYLGFFVRGISGSHHIASKEGVIEIVNVQPKGDGKAKGYQLGQVRDIVNKYNLKP